MQMQQTPLMHSNHNYHWKLR